MMPAGILLKGGTLVDPGTEVFGRRDLLIRNGVVERAAPSLEPFGQWKQEGEALLLVDLKGDYVFPGLIDLHTHLRVPGQEHKETVRTGSQAAAAGGFTTILTMPNTKPCVDSVEVLRALMDRYSAEAVVRVHPVAAITRGLAGNTLVDFQGLRNEGAVAFSDDGMPVMDPQRMREAMTCVLDVGAMIISHCEDRTLSGTGVVQEGPVADRLGVHGISHASEEVMVERDIALAADTGVRLHLAHLSTAGAVARVREAKAKGLRVTAEATPHHLMLTQDDVPALGGNGKVNPPLRTAEDRDALHAGLKDGTLDAVASDHAPHHPDEKAMPLPEAPFGMVGLETTLPVVYHLVEQGVIPLNRAVQLLSSGPADALGLGAGRLSVGATADLVVVDTSRAFRVFAATFRSKGRNCPFEGFSLKARPVVVLLEGDIIHKDGTYIDARTTRL